MVKVCTLLLLAGASLLLVLLDHAVYAAITEGDKLRVSHEALQRQAKNAGSEYLKLHEKSSGQVDYSAKLAAEEAKVKELRQQVGSKSYLIVFVDGVRCASNIMFKASCAMYYSELD